jgi:hypothetical protein
MLPFLALLLTFSSTLKDTPGAIVTCSTLTRFQVETALGHRLNQDTEEYSRFACTRNYSADDVAVTISIQHLTSALDLNAELGSLKAAFPGAKLSEVKGLAERAFALDIPGAGTQLHVLPDEREYLLISVLGVGGDDHGFNAAIRIARSLMSR